LVIESYNAGMMVRDGSKRWPVSLPSAVFALAFVLLGWIAGHSIAYQIVGLAPHDHGHYDPLHGYFEALKLAGGTGLIVAFGTALRFFFRHGSFGEWLEEGGASGTRRQVALATVLPASVFVAAEHLERMAAGTGDTPSARLLVVGVLVQIFVGLLCLALVRLTFHVAERVIRGASAGFGVRSGRVSVGVVLENVATARPPCPMASAKAGRAPPAPS
jgi:hypothetical protein